jgi:formylglycine-generating enzyme required for sulfatase activity
MVLVPAGTAFMGDDDGRPDQKPQHVVDLDAFFIDVYEVTNFEYREFVRATGRAAPPHWIDGASEAGRDLHPVVNVTWEDAVAYAAWAGKRLPTEAEWEKACRGPDGRAFAYGDAFREDCTNWGSSGICDTVRVDAMPANASPYGCRHMTGNVWEWVSDWYAKGHPPGPRKNPRGSPSGVLHVGKGGSWTTDSESCKAAYRCRSMVGSRWGYAGFRCAKDARDAADIRPPGEDAMVLIPEGWFEMGEDGSPFSAPRRRIWVDAFRIDTYPVTNRRYAEYCAAAKAEAPPQWRLGCPPEGEEDHPVVNVTLEEARAYAAWAGKRLPTEAEWEKAARGEDGRFYPWGNSFDPKMCNTLDAEIGHSVKVGTYPAAASPYGVHDMCGNVWQWVEGAFDPKYYAEMPERNPKGSARGPLIVLRGGTWSTCRENCRTYWRCPSLKGARWSYCGFRCAKDAGK